MGKVITAITEVFVPAGTIALVELIGDELRTIGQPMETVAVVAIAVAGACIWRASRVAEWDAGYVEGMRQGAAMLPPGGVRFRVDDLTTQTLYWAGNDG